MGKDALRYDQMVEEALRSVVRKALSQAAESGLPGAHHFYVTFETNHPGAVLSDSLRARYPDEMTIILQHQFWGLEVEDIRFSVTLSFNDRHERITVPFEAITAFADPAVKFGLRFERQEDGAASPAGSPSATNQSVEKSEGAKPRTDQSEGEGAKVVALESFRKK
ncbi:MAG TPA: ClpXP protease specificity-enhancing factor SspB [Alphaproteobacteria bacterium]|nr:ClpXP protease specificity-enhancing factor SspB [Alphaproteobacteria bacterium]